jgi:hypothetical protein
MASHAVRASDMWDCAKNWSCWRLHGAAMRGASAYQGEAVEGENYRG